MTTTLTTVAPPLAANESLTRQLYTMADLMRIARISRKQTTYWTQIELLKPTFRNPQATTGQPATFYSASEVIKALIVCYLRRAGFSLRQVQEVVRYLHEHGISLSESEAYLLTDGYSIYLAHNDQEVVDILKNHGQMLLLVPIHDQISKLKKAA